MATEAQGLFVTLYGGLIGLTGVLLVEKPPAPAAFGAGKCRHSQQRT